MTLNALKAQHIYIHYYDPEVIILTPYDYHGWNFCNRESLWIYIGDTLTYSFISSHIDSLVYANASDNCKFPNVSQRIVVLKPHSEEYDMIFSDGRGAMEKNGRCVLFDEELQRVINDIIKRDIANRKKKKNSE
jgi:hypothetical protein